MAENFVAASSQPSGLLDDTGPLAGRDGLATFEGPGSGTAGDQEREHEAGTEKEGKVIQGGGT